MSELLFGLIGVAFLYGMGKVLLPDYEHIPIQQELIKMGDEKDE
tara:strand:- start:86 stop:217 length:132 start_codon:yes stop_codon:yes gene_type:complete